MKRAKLAVVLTVVFVFAALAAAQDSTEVAKAPYLTDVHQAKAEAAQSGKHALIYFYSET